MSLGVPDPQYLSKQRRRQLVSQVAHRTGQSKSETRRLLLGELPSDSVLDTLRKARILVFPSLWYEGMPMAPNVIAAMSLVPDAVRDLRRLSDVHYISDAQVANPFARGEVLSRPQIELIAARVSALNECFY